LTRRSTLSGAVNHLGEMMIYGSFAMMVWHWLSFLVLAWSWDRLFTGYIALKEPACRGIPTGRNTRTFVVVSATNFLMT
jgi:hypothetical protein